MKRTLIVIALIAALIAPVWAQNQGTTPDGFEWYKDGNGIMITKYTGTATAVRIPDRINNLPVVTIGEGAFDFTDGATRGITSVVMPNTVTTIEERAFTDCSALTSITLSTSIREIKRSAFLRCTALTSITLPSSVTTIGNTAFFNCTALTTVSLPASITNIGNQAFNGCTALTTVTIPASVTRITFGANAFAGVTNLNAVSVATLQRVGYVF